MSQSLSRFWRQTVSITVTFLEANRLNHCHVSGGRPSQSLSRFWRQTVSITVTFLEVDRLNHCHVPGGRPSR